MNDILKIAGGAVAAIVAVLVISGVIHWALPTPKHVAEPVVYHAPIPPDPPIVAPEPAPEPSWADAVPEYKRYSPVPLPPVKKKRLHRKHRVCAPAQVPGLLLPPFMVRP